MSAKKPRLGRGLDALLGTGNKGAAPSESTQSDESLQTLPIGQMQPGRYQPRTGMDPERLTELAESIKAQGVIQPIVVRLIAANKYEIIAGERRWRAATQAGLKEIPVVIRKVDDRAVIAMALIENIQREDLNPLEEAQALSRLIEEFDLTHQQAAEAVGRSRAAVSNLVRLLELPDPIRKLLEERKLEMGHARALLTLATPMAVALAKEAAEQGLSVREVERRASELAKGKIPSKVGKKSKAGNNSPDIENLERELSDSLGSRVQVQHGKAGKGKLVIHYHGVDALEGVLERLRNRP